MKAQCAYGRAYRQGAIKSFTILRDLHTLDPVQYLYVAGRPQVPGHFQAVPRIAGFAEQLYMDTKRVLGCGNTGDVVAGGNLHQLLQGRPQWAVKVCAIV